MNCFYIVIFGHRWIKLGLLMERYCGYVGNMIFSDQKLSVQIQEKCPLNDGIPQFSYMISIFIRNYHQNQALSQNQFWETVLQYNFGNVYAVRLVLISPIMWGQSVSTSYKNNSFNSNKAAVGKIRFGGKVGNYLENAIFQAKGYCFQAKAHCFQARGHFFNTKGTFSK